MKRLLAAAAILAGYGPATAREALVPGELGVVFQVGGDFRSGQELRGVEDALSMLAARGWQVQNLRVGLAEDPFDATLAGADVVLPLALPPEDKLFLLAEAVVRRALKASELQDSAAGLVAAHLSPPTSRLRQSWERAWQKQLLAGELQRTALLELLWRSGGDGLLRSLFSWAEAWQFLTEELADGKLEETLWDIISAGLLDPARLGFTVPPANWAGKELASDSVLFRLVVPQLRWLTVDGNSEAVGLWAGRLVRASGRVFVAYDDGRFDLVPLATGQELQVPRLGVRSWWVGLMSLPGEATVSLSFRHVQDYPVRLRSVEFRQENHSWQLAWEVEEQSDVQAYVVEVWGVSPGGETLQARELIPTVDGNIPVQLFWAGEATDSPSQVRLYALTRAGLLARIFSTPVVSPEPSSNYPDQAP